MKKYNCQQINNPFLTTVLFSKSADNQQVSLRLPVFVCCPAGFIPAENRLIGSARGFY